MFIHEKKNKYFMCIICAENREKKSEPRRNGWDIAKQ